MERRDRIRYFGESMFTNSIRDRKEQWDKFGVKNTVKKNEKPLVKVK
jgi:hypothetical protein